LFGVLASGATTPFGIAATNWKCTSDGNIYTPTYNATTKKGKFYIKSSTPLDDGPTSFTTCKNLGATRVQPATTDDIYSQVLPKYTIPATSGTNGIWIGAFLDPRYNNYYWDSGSILDSRAPTAKTSSCVTGSVATGTITFNTNACNGTFKTLCTF